MRAIHVIGAIAVAILATAEHSYAQNLESSLRQFTGAWNRNDEKAIASMIARDGASIDIPGGKLAPLSGRQAAAVLRVLFEEGITRDVRLRQAQSIGGDPEKAYAELVWTTVAPETTQPIRSVVFVELVRENEKTWRVTKIRLLP